MSDKGVDLKTVNLENCDREPIHTPGSIQPHGVLIAMDRHGVLTHASRNAPQILPDLPGLGQHISAAFFRGKEALFDATTELLQLAAEREEVQPVSIEATVHGKTHDVVLFAHAGRAVIEFEPRGSDSSELSEFAMLAHRSMVRLKGQPDFNAILGEAARTVRRLTGFDRVMAYRFHADDSGEVVAEAKFDALIPYLGRRFPASDIPVQARRLYVANTLRLIADVNDAQVPIDALDPRAPALDLSNSILRSVSPIHIEYLKNINVAASMSVSIVVGGKLWGLIACHHRTAHRVPYSVRMACDVLANVVSSAVQVVQERLATQRSSAAAELRARLVEAASQGDEALPVAVPTRATFSDVIACDRLLYAHGTRLHHEGIDSAAAAELLRWLESQPEDFVAMDQLPPIESSAREALAPLCGLLALRHDRHNHGWIVFMRNEQRAPMIWSGPPDKAVRLGPLGIRLTPDGSLAEWQQAVSGRAEPWDASDLSIARQLLDELSRASGSRAAEMDRARMHLLAVLGHDLRDPLQSINMAARMLDRGGDHATMATRISASSSRMGRLIAQVMDMSRLQGGLGLGLDRKAVHLSDWVASLVEESRLAYPGARIETDIEATIQAVVDRDRVAQVVSNLLSNARQHGSIGTPIRLRLAVESNAVTLRVSNQAEPIADDLLPTLFDPFKRGSLSGRRNPSGLGLGLYIASEVAKGHGGSLTYHHEEGQVVFLMKLPWGG